jgi:hypothetical protein
MLKIATFVYSPYKIRACMFMTCCNHVKAPIQDHHYYKLLSPLFYGDEILENKAKIRKKIDKEEKEEDNK